MKLQGMVLSFASVAILLSVTIQERSTKTTGRKLLVWGCDRKRTNDPWKDAPIKEYPTIEITTVPDNHTRKGFYLGRSGTDASTVLFDFLEQKEGAKPKPVQYGMLTKLVIPARGRFGRATKIQTKDCGKQQEMISKYGKALDKMGRKCGISFGDFMFDKQTYNKEKGKLVTGKLFLGCVNAAENEDKFLDKNKITAVFSLYEIEVNKRYKEDDPRTGEKFIGVPKYPEDKLKAAGKLLILSLNTKDERGIEQEDFTKDFGNAADMIFRWLGEGKNVLLHCQLGQSRSVAVLMIFLIKYRGMNVDKAIKFIQQRRRKAQLGTWESYVNKYYRNRTRKGKNDV